jgi:hypothetical protein
MDSLDRLYRRVADVLLRQPDAQVTVGDIYQNLAPYRSVRGELGFTELAEYEHALLRLLAGERDYMIVERSEVQEELQRELRAPNPILGVYRDYAAVGVYLNPFAAVPAPDPTPVPAANGNGSGEATVERPKPAGADAAATPALRLARRPCPGCRSALPAGREVRFCPFCGKCLAPIPCPECSAVVEPEWKFCASCGWPRGDEPAPPVPTRVPEQRLR